MRWLVIHANPDPESLGSTLLGAVISGLHSGGAEVETIDLYDLDYRAAMSDEEHRHYETIADAHPDPLVSHHLEMLSNAEGLVFVFPTWWGSVPAILKGWIERTMLPGVAFKLDPVDRSLQPGLTHVHRLVGVTTYGGARWQQYLLGDGGRSLITRTIWTMCSRTTRRSWLALDKVETRDASEVAAFTEELTNSFGRWA